MRVDSHAYQGFRISPYYDSMIAKLIVHAPTRDAAIVRMRRALDELVCEGIQTNLAMHRWLFKQPGFVAGEYDTHFLERHLDPEAILADFAAGRPA